MMTVPGSKSFPSTQNMKEYAIAFFKWFSVAIVIGICCGAVAVLFHRSIEWGDQLMVKYLFLLYCLPIAGLLIVLMYSICHMQDDGGTNRIFESAQSGAKVPFRMFPLIFIATFLTHFFGGSSGREGAALQIGGSIGNNVGTLFHFSKNDMRLITLCGMSAVFSGLFGTPLTAAIFCIEVTSIGVIHYSALIPCLRIKSVAYLFAGYFGMEAMAFDATAFQQAFSWFTAVKTIPLAMLCAAVSIIICILFKHSGKLFAKLITNPALRIALGGLLVVLITLALGTRDFNGGGIPFIVNTVNSGKVVFWACIAKLVLTAITLGSGFKGGEIIPTMFIGATFGAAIGPLLGLDASFAAGIALIAVFCGVVNCPLASTFLAVELFGADTILYFALACAISYMMSGQFSLYTAQLFLSSKLKPTNVKEEPPKGGSPKQA